MKVIVALFALVAAATAVYVPSAYSYGFGAPLAYSSHYAGYAASPLAYSAPLSYAASPLAYSAYAAPVVAAAPAIQSGYVAATRGSVHTAPLPEGPFAASHHINTAPAPGTY